MKFYNVGKKFWLFVALYLSLCLTGPSLAYDSFIDKGDNTIVDVTTGLMWQKLTPDSLSFADASAACANLTLAGHTNWRLPEVKELLSIVDFTRADPAINILYFPGTSGLYWMNTTDFGAVKPRLLYSSQGQITEIVTSSTIFHNGVFNYRCVCSISSE